MTFVQATAGRGGWPVERFCLPTTLNRFSAATYFPPGQPARRPASSSFYNKSINSGKHGRDASCDLGRWTSTRAIGADAGGG